MPEKPPPKKPPGKKAAAPLDRYRAKRDFAATPEPAGGAPGSGRSFVVQEHHARSHHFDFRLEIDGVLASWAVPKGVPEDTAAKRLAVQVEDHPLEYGGFEGEIPKGNYGAGKVSIWDRGEWQPLGRDWRKAFAAGKLKFTLRGDRLHGSYLLARMKDGPNWLLRKIDDEIPLSPSFRPAREKAGFVPPQLARVVPAVPSGKSWLHEIKYDGYRLIAVHRAGKLRLFTRNGLDWTDRFPALAETMRRLSPDDFVLDGEAVVFDGKGRSSFGALQAALQSGAGGEIVFVAFDLLHHDGFNLRELPLSERLRKLAELVPHDQGAIRRSTAWAAGEGAELFRQACSNGLEGIISKNPAGRYRPASRKEWVKSKCRARQEFVICGYTPPQRSLPAFGAILLASFENGKWVPRGKVGTGFSHAQRGKLLEIFRERRTSDALFPPSVHDVTWLKPELVAEIEFAGITRDGAIRQGSFVALREDKRAEQVRLDGVQKADPDETRSNVAGIHITHPSRPVFPSEGITKIEVARYFERVGDLMLPYLARRPLAILRAPAGISGETFFQKSFSSHVPPHVFPDQLDDGTEIFSIRTVKGLISLAQFGAIEFHPWGSRLPEVEKPDSLIWDLDPDAEVPWPEVLGAAFLLRDLLHDHGLQPLVKTSGGKGLHLVLPLRRVHDWDTLRPFAKAVSAELATRNPKRFTIVASKARRKGRIYIDWMRNGRGSTCIVPWGLRARPGAPVSMPVEWDALPEATASGFTLREPPATPESWLHPKLQSITRPILSRFGISPPA